MVVREVRRGGSRVRSERRGKGKGLEQPSFSPSLSLSTSLLPSRRRKHGGDVRFVVVVVLFVSVISMDIFLSHTALFFFCFSFFFLSLYSTYTFVIKHSPFLFSFHLSSSSSPFFLSSFFLKLAILNYTTTIITTTTDKTAGI